MAQTRSNPGLSFIQMAWNKLFLKEDDIVGWKQCLFQSYDAISSTSKLRLACGILPLEESNAHDIILNTVK